MVTSRLGAPGQGTESAPPCGPGLGLPGADSGETLPSASGLDMHAWTKLSSRFCLSLFVGSPGMCWLLGSITNLFASLCPCAGCGVRGAWRALQCQQARISASSPQALPLLLGGSAPFQRADGLGVLVLDPQAQVLRSWEEGCSQVPPRTPLQPANLPLPSQSSEGHALGAGAEWRCPLDLGS